MRKYVLLWYFSVMMFFVSVIPFVVFMYNIELRYLKPLLLCIIVAAVPYAISSRKITLPQGYTAVQAVRFYNACKKQKISKPEQVRKHTLKVKEIASELEFAKELDQNSLQEMFEIGYGIAKRKEE